MYVEENCIFDPNSIPDSADPEDGFNLHRNGFYAADASLKHSAEELAYQHHDSHHQEDVVAAASAAALEIEFQQQQQQLAFGMESSYNNGSGGIDINTTTVGLVSFDYHHPNWHHHHHHHQQQQQLPEQPDLLNLFHFPRCSPSSSSLLPTSTITFANSPSSCSSVLYDPLLHLNLPPQPPLFKELFQSLPNGYNAFPSASRNNNGSLFGTSGDIEREGSAGIYGQDGPEGLQFENGVLEFTRDRTQIDRGRDGRGTKHFASERHRRDQMRDTYTTLRSLVPNPTKNDRASVVGDAIEYIQELRRTVNELRLLVEKKRRGRESSKRQKTEEDNSGDIENCHIKMEPEQSYMRSSWLQRKSKDTEVDVRIIDDEVTVKLVQRKKINLLLTASRVLDELQLDLRHVAGGHVGDTYSFLFNTKIYEGSSLYASAIANKLIDVLDTQYAAIIPATTSY